MKILSFKQIIGIMSIVLLLICFSEAKAQQSDIKFDSTKFYVVHEKPNNGFLWFGTHGGDSNRYRLTNTDPDKGIAMWHTGGPGQSGNTLDMASEWVFNFRLYFGNGRVTKFIGGNKI